MTQLFRVLRNVAVCTLLAGVLVPVAGLAREIPQLDTMQYIKLVGAEKGKVVVVNFFASWCAPCREEIPDLIELRKEFSKSDMTLIGISVDESIPQLTQMMEDTNFNYPVYLADEELTASFGITGIPRLFVYDTQSKLKIDHVGIADSDALRDVVTKLMEQ